MARAKTTRGRKPPDTTPPLFVRTVTVSATEQALLQRLSQDVSDAMGRRISSSAVVRAVVRLAARQPYTWLLAELRPEVEQEGSAHVWGKRAKS